jgi:ferredoxin
LVRAAAAPAPATYSVTLRTPTGDHTFKMGGDQTIMDAVLERGIDVDHMCLTGA